MLAQLATIRPQMMLLLLITLPTLIGLAAYIHLFKAPIQEFIKLRDLHHQYVTDMGSMGATSLETAFTAGRNRIAALEKRLHGNDERLPSNQLESFIIGRLDMLSKKHGVHLESVNPIGVTPVQEFLEVPFEIEVTGDFFALFAWVADVERTLNPMIVKQFSLLPAGQQAVTRNTAREESGGWNPAAGLIDDITGTIQQIQEVRRLAAAPLVPDRSKPSPERTPPSDDLLSLKLRIVSYKVQ
ncbi:MAG: type 4a pilus biogenesis protein PilO [Magnetococcales bacterium]|nr:type 4a pilus biogenesis protein PilO [Magnetococcales bacterium]